MSYFVDSITSEDTYYDNLTLGLPKILESIPRIRFVTMDRRLPCDRLLLNSWEQRQCCSLPEDMRQFYSSSDGFKLVWCYEYSPDEVLQVGCLHIACLGELVQPSGLRDQLEQNPPKASLLGSPTIGPKSKIIEMDDIDGLAKVCLVFESSELPARIWLLDHVDNGTNLQWTLLANSFSQYLRMAIVHLGLPHWQLCFSQQGLLPWSEQLFMLVAPHLLPNETPNRLSMSSLLEVPENKIDPNIFKPKQKNTKLAKNNHS